MKFLLLVTYLLLSMTDVFSQNLQHGNEWATCHLIVSFYSFCQDKKGPNVTNHDLIEGTSKYQPKWNEQRIQQEQELKWSNNATNFQEHDMSKIKSVPSGEIFYYGTSGLSMNTISKEVTALECSMNFGDYFYRNNAIQFPSSWYDEKNYDGKRYLKSDYLLEEGKMSSANISYEEFKLIESYVPVCIDHLKQFCEGNLKFLKGNSRDRLKSPFNLESGITTYWSTTCFTK